MVVYTIIMVFYGFYCMIVGILAYAEFSGVIKSYNQIVDNLNNSPIAQIKKTDTTCEQGWTSLFEFDWKGTGIGCDCTNANVNSVAGLTAKLYTGSCNNN